MAAALARCGASTAFAYTFTVMNTVQDPQNLLARSTVVQVMYLLIESSCLRFSSELAVELNARHCIGHIAMSCGLQVHGQVLVLCTLS